MAKTSRSARARLASTVSARYYPDNKLVDAYFLDGRFNGKTENKAAGNNSQIEDRGFVFALFAYPAEDGGRPSETAFAPSIHALWEAVKRGSQAIDTQINDLADCAIEVCGKATLPKEGVRQAYFAGLIVKEGELAAVTTASGCAFLFRNDVLYPLTAGEYELEAIDVHGNAIEHLNDYSAGVAGTIRYSNLPKIQQNDCLILCNKDLMDILGQREILRILDEAEDQQDAAMALIAAASEKRPETSVQVMISFVEQVEEMEKSGRIGAFFTGQTAAAAAAGTPEAAYRDPAYDPYQDNVQDAYNSENNDERLWKAANSERVRAHEAAGIAGAAAAAGAAGFASQHDAPYGHYTEGVPADEFFAANDHARQGKYRDDFDTVQYEGATTVDHQNDYNRRDYDPAQPPRYAETQRQGKPYGDAKMNPPAYNEADHGDPRYRADSFQNPNYGQENYEAQGDGASDFYENSAYDQDYSSQEPHYPVAEAEQKTAPDLQDQASSYQQQANSAYDQAYDQDYDPNYAQGNYQQGYDQGYDQQGYDQGYDQQGYDQGYDQQGYDQGYDQQGYDQGYDQQGYDQGYDQQGYGQGYDQQGDYDNYPNDGYQDPYADQYYDEYQDHADETLNDRDRMKRILFYAALGIIVLLCLLLLWRLVLSPKPKETTAAPTLGTTETQSTSSGSESVPQATSSTPSESSSSSESSQSGESSSSSESSSASESKSGEPKTYVVRENDTLYAICVSYYGYYDDNLGRMLIAANPGLIDENGNVFLDTTITLPPLPEN